MSELSIECDFKEQYPHLAQTVYPNANGCTVTLKDGRTLGYSEHGTCNSDASLVVVLLPGTPGSRFFVPHAAVTWATEANARLVVVERPGLGLSSAPPPGTVTLLSFADDFRQFCSHLGLRDVCLLGYSSGTPTTLAVAASCPDLVRAVALVGAISPPFPGVTKGMSYLFAFGHFACSRMQWLVRWMILREGPAARKLPLATLRDSMGQYTCTADKEALKKPDIEGLFLESYCELMSRGQEVTILQETLNWAQPWPFQLSHIKVPVGLWQGEHDRGTTKHMAEHLHKSIAGSCCTIVPQGGHFILFEVLGDVLSWLQQQGHAKQRPQ